MSKTQKSSLFLGIDGCPAGWVGVIADRKCRFVESPLLWHSAQEMVAALDSFKLALIDIPIGLPSGSPGRRSCDIEARQLLGAKRSSVFLPAVRQTLRAKNYQQANEINYKVCGKRISKPDVEHSAKNSLNR